MQANRKPSTQRGLTLIELLTTLALVGVLLASATPSLHHMVQHRRLDGVVQTYLSQLHWARLQTVALNQAVYIGFGRTASHSCYLFYIGERDQCQCGANGPACTAGARPLVSTTLPLAQGVSVDAGTRSTITVDALRGTVTPTFTAVFTARNGSEVQAKTSIMGRTRTCSPSPGALGLPACT